MILRNREISKHEEIEKIIQEAEVCYLGMTDGDQPYVLPFNFAYQNETLFLHSDHNGYKLDVLARNSKICANFNVGNELFSRNKEVGCSWGMKYKSVNLFGNLEIVEDYDEKYQIMKLFMLKYAGEDYEFSEPSIKNVMIMKVQAVKLTGKKYGY